MSNDPWDYGIFVTGIAMLITVVFLINRRGSLTASKKLNWDKLRILMKDSRTIEKCDISALGRSPDSQMQLQFTCGADTVVYYRTTRPNGTRAETLDVSCQGEAPFLIIFQDEVPSFFRKIGSRNLREPEFPSEERMVLLGLLRRMRSYADDPTVDIIPI